MKDSGSAVNLVSASTDDAEKVFQEAIEQVTKKYSSFKSYRTHTIAAN